MMNKENMISDQLPQYYAAIAQDYDGVYGKPERQQDLQEMHGKVAELLRGHKVLEIACGTGYWTEKFAPGATSVVATDINPGMLELANARLNGSAEGAGLAGKVQFSLADAFDLPADLGSESGKFTACFAGFWWSHVKREDQERFLGHLRERLGKDILLVLLDNVYVDGSSTVIARTDAAGNTYQIRQIADGRRFEVLKNFPSDSTLRKKLASSVREIRIHRLEYYWLLSCRLK
jgi:SAM-dependent methyltransferase